MDQNTPDLFEQFTHLNWLLHRYHQQNHRDFGPMGDIHRGQGRILALLKLKPEISQRELSNILNIRSQSLGELLAKLEKNGYITRTPSETDRRVMEIRLTEAGEKVSIKNEQQLDTDALFSGLSEEEQDTLSDYLNRIIANLEESFGDDTPENFDDRPPFGGRGYGFHPGMHHRRPPFEDRSFYRWSGMGERGLSI
jgi:DNA-binding MarR family transcriptional regulator